MGNTLGIHWTAPTHGTWLHGDLRGSWRDGRLIGPDPFLQAAMRARMSSDAVFLSKTEKQLVADTFGEVVRERRHRVLAAAIRPSHLHLVFAPLRENIERVITRLKHRSAVSLFSHRRRITFRECSDPEQQFFLPRSLWTGGKYVVFVYAQSHLQNTIEYVRNHNCREGLPADPFDWITPLEQPAALDW